jgi:hypothetical protein
MRNISKDETMQKIEKGIEMLDLQYKETLEKAKDKPKAHNIFLLRLKSEAEKLANNEGCVEVVEKIDSYVRLGNTITGAIEKLREYLPYAHMLEVMRKKDIGLEGLPDDIALDILKSRPDFGEILENYNYYTIRELYNGKKGAFSIFIKWHLCTDEELENTFTQYKILHSYTQKLESLEDVNSELDPAGINPDKSLNKKHTTARQVSAMHFIFDSLGVDKKNISAKAEFIHFLTGKSYGNIKNRVSNPYNLSEKVFVEDMRYIREFFSNLGLDNIVKKINSEIG